jgi:hypothetical protein
LLHAPLITHAVSNITSYAGLCSQGDCVTEHDKPLHGTVAGTTPGSSNNANAGNVGQDAQQLLAPIRDQGVQLAPASGAGGGGGGGLPAPPAAAGGCEPPPGDGTPLVPDLSLLTLLPGNNQNQGTASGGQSFTGDTRVLLPGAKTAPISSLKPGDKVLATDTKTGKDQPETVTAVEVHHDTDLYDLTVKTSHGTKVIHTTSNHLFWVPGAGGRGGRWVKAGALRHGAHLRTPAGTDAAVTGSYTPRQHDGLMWDLTITPDHDFYVQAASTAVLVHNDSCPVTTTKDVFASGSGKRVEPPWRAGKEYSVDDSGKLAPQSGQEWPNGFSTNSSMAGVPRGGFNTDMWRLPAGTELPEGMGVIQDGSEMGGPSPEGHVTFYPTQAMEPTAFRQMFRGLGWVRVGPLDG